MPKRRRSTNRRSINGGSPNNMNLNENHEIFIPPSPPPQLPLPVTNVLSQFAITDTDLFNFRTVVYSPRDCVINAMQIIGMLNNYSGNLLRIFSAGYSGFTTDQIERVFILYHSRNFKFVEIPSISTFSEYLRKNLNYNHVAFAGYSGHVFLIGRSSDGRMVYIDPQVNNGTICDLQYTDCQTLINHPPWYLLMHSERGLTFDEFRSVGFKV